MTCLAGTLLVVASCQEFATPAELDRPQILAIAADPPAVRAGEGTPLTILVAGPDGAIDSPEVTWASVPPFPNAVALGSVAVDEDGSATYIAPADQPADNPALAMVQATVTTGDDAPLVGTKGIAVGSVRLSNPTLVRFDAGADDLMMSDQLAVTAPATVTLEVDIEGGLGPDATVSWYSTAGSIELYRSNPSEIVFEEAARGVLFAVVRDGQGGVVWRQVSVVAD